MCAIPHLDISKFWAADPCGKAGLLIKSRRSIREACHDHDVMNMGSRLFVGSHSQILRTAQPGAVIEIRVIEIW